MSDSPNDYELVAIIAKGVEVHDVPPPGVDASKIWEAVGRLGGDKYENYPEPGTVITQESLDALTEIANKLDPPCSGPGYAHKPHGRCMGYSTDRT